MNLLDQFILQHVQVSLLEARLKSPPKQAGSREAQVELKLSPRPVKTNSGDALPAYQVSARLSCRSESDDGSSPHFAALVGVEAVYQQMDGDPLDMSDFSSHHGSLTRQLYPLLAQELRLLLLRLGLEQVKLPFDLPARVDISENQTVEVSGAVH
ncbi:MAG: hypothetical protein KJO72_04960 [Gammaproteobacteria bacterium]|nr:hypothetical protein [Gammaproteobacteria bacterium]